MKNVFLIVFFLLSVGSIILMRYTGRKMHYKKLRWIFGGYIAILLVSLAVINILPEGDFLKEETAKQNDQWMTDREYQDFYNAAEGGRLDQIKSAHKNKEWSFEYTGEQLNIVTVTEQRENFDIRVVVKNKDIDENIIEAASYVGKSIMNGIEYTDKIKPPELILEKNQLKIIKPGRLEIKLAGFYRDLTTKQFFSRDRNNNGLRGSVNVSRPASPVLYIQIPKNVQVEEYY